MISLHSLIFSCHINLIFFSSRDKSDHDILRENHRFLWSEDDSIDNWGKELAKKYCDKLFKEYCICDLTRYKENKVSIYDSIHSLLFIN